MLSAERWFFCRIEGRRRIGKTSLLGQLAKEDLKLGSRFVYMQVPDSDERDVAATFAQSLSRSEVDSVVKKSSGVNSFMTMAAAIGELCAEGFIVVLDEFQYFTRSKLSAFNSFLQAEVDRLREASLKQGGLFVLGSLQSEMNALLDDRAAPLYGRITSRISLDHWDFDDLLAVFDAHGVREPSQWLTLWTFFEGVPKFYKDAFERGLFDVGSKDLASQLLAKMFINSSSPLSEEADTWFLRELRGRAVSILNYLANNAGCSHGDITANVSGDDSNALGTHIVRLVDHYKMVDKLQPIFSGEKSRNARYYIADNFLQAWLSVAKPAREEAKLKPVDRVLPPVLRKLETLEGFAFEKLIRRIHVEASKKNKGDFELSEIKLGYWNRTKDSLKSIEIDLVASNSSEKIIRFGSCKRSDVSHDLMVFERHVSEFMKVRENKKLADWKRQMVLFSPKFSEAKRQMYESKGYLVRDLEDYARLFR